MPLHRRLCTPVAAALLVALLAACAFAPYSPSGVPPGASRAEIERTMGPPTNVYTMADGHQRLEYNRLPAGKQTFMIDLDAGGRMARWENVLDERHFASIVPGMTTADVQRLIGPPTFTSIYHRPEPGVTWNYRFETIQRCVVFQVDFNAASGRVLGGAYPNDPGCADEWM